jgi:hypothetical protein
MLRAVKLDHKLCLCAIEIDDVFSDYLLTIEILRPELKKIVPEMSFLFRHISSQLLRKRR